MDEGSQIPLEIPEYGEIKSLEIKIKVNFLLFYNLLFKNYISRAEIEANKGTQIESLESINSIVINLNFCLVSLIYRAMIESYVN